MFGRTNRFRGGGETGAAGTAVKALLPAVLLFMALWWLGGCTTGRETIRRTPPPEPKSPDEVSIADTLHLDSLAIPAGVDTAVAREATRAARHVMVGSRADSLSELYFDRAEKAREEGHPLAELWLKGAEPPETPPAPADTMKAFEITLEADAQLRAVQEILGEEYYALSQSQLARIRPQLRQRAADKLESARDYLQQALNYNPWDSYSRVSLINVLEDLAKLHQSLDNMAKAVEQTEILLQTSRSDHLIALRLADRFLMLGDSVEALKMYRHSEDLLLTWAPITGGSSSQGPTQRRTQLDSLEYSDWLVLVREQMYLEQDLLMGNDLITDANRLKAMARPGVPDDTAFAAAAKDMLDWIGWDEGNIYTASARVPVIQLINQGSYEEARKEIKSIRDDLQARNAKLEMDTLAAMLDFGFLDRREAALERLRDMLRESGFAEIDSSLDTLLARHGTEGFAELMREQRRNMDPRLERVLELYGSFATRYANRLEKQERTRETAYVYYYQASLVPHEEQAFALMALSNMSSQDPKRAVRYGEAALEENLPGQLAPTDRRALYELMVSAYRNLNDLNRAEHYFELLEEAG
ncbi:MAG: hypothetical protein MAG453_02125 [Calditrichaeota bacterium]|nr:hypothetical protein [Calditrichota bacterium]